VRAPVDAPGFPRTRMYVSLADRRQEVITQPECFARVSATRAINRGRPRRRRRGQLHAAATLLPSRLDDHTLSPYLTVTKEGLRTCTSLAAVRRGSTCSFPQIGPAHPLSKRSASRSTVRTPTRRTPSTFDQRLRRHHPRDLSARVLTGQRFPGAEKIDELGGGAAKRCGG